MLYWWPRFVQVEKIQLATNIQAPEVTGQAQGTQQISSSYVVKDSELCQTAGVA